MLSLRVAWDKKQRRWLLLYGELLLGFYVSYDAACLAASKYKFRSVNVYGNEMVIMHRPMHS